MDVVKIGALSILLEIECGDFISELIVKGVETPVNQHEISSSLSWWLKQSEQTPQPYPTWNFKK